MKRVYEGSDSVVIWLGDPTDDTEQAFKYISHVCDSASDGEAYYNAEAVLASFSTSEISRMLASAA